jgi:hypothetical protein
MKVVPLGYNGAKKFLSLSDISATTTLQRAHYLRVCSDARVNILPFPSYKSIKHAHVHTVCGT